ncbi:MAG TPA: nucleotidyltransferase family protein [Streptosporangiaceae bacterium]
MSDPAEQELQALVRSSDWLMTVLAAVRDERVPDGWTGAGVLRDLVWGERYGHGFRAAEVHDVDVAFFDPASLSRAHDDAVTAALAARLPGVPWQARNQAAVHTWYAARFGGEPPAPLVSIADAVGTWPETATAVAVRLSGSGTLEVCAPYGLADLLGGIWRWNPRRVSAAFARQRLARHRPAVRWPGVTVISPG